MKTIKRSQAGFSLVEVIVAASIFAVVALSIYHSFVSITTLISLSRDKIAATDLINAEFELVRNLSYSQVGTIGGIPNGSLAATTTKTIDGNQFEITRVIRNIDDPFDGKIGGTPNDLSPADYKMVQIEVDCLNCKNTISYKSVARVAPKNLETASTNGALFVKVFDANGNPVPQADVQVQNSSLGININETTDNNGTLQIVDAPPSQNKYRIIATKSGYTTDRTYATSTSNPNPVKLDATVILQQLTQVSFVIDKVSELKVNTMTSTCAEVPSVPFTITGTKLIGTTPDILKWTGNFTTDSFGFKSVSDLEWDTLSFSLGGGYYLAGTNPIFPVSILPDSSQKVDLVISNESPSFLLVGVKDAATGFPISGATVRLYDGSYNNTLVTDQGYLKQTDWSGGGGQNNYSDPTRFYSSDSNIETNNPVGDLVLSQSLGVYSANGVLTSSIFDTGTSSNWSRVDIYPTDQPVAAGPNSVRFQIATAPENTATTTWNYFGPDGTASTYYTITNNTINAVHDGDRYIRYKIYLSTEDTSVTPNVSDFVISFSSSCIPPGQALFSNLSNGNYTLQVSATGYNTQTIDPVSVSGTSNLTNVLLSP